MDAKTLAELETKIAALRKEREETSKIKLAARAKARDLSEQILVLERQLPPTKARNAIRMSVEPAKISAKPKA